MENKRKTGSDKEERACIFLEQQGYKVVEKNFRNRFGEIDIIAKDGGYLVFVEVKYRKNRRTGGPEEAVDKKKQMKICKVSDYYRVLRNVPDFQCCRFDVVAITGEKDKEEIMLYKNSFEYCVNQNRW